MKAEERRELLDAIQANEKRIAGIDRELKEEKEFPSMTPELVEAVGFEREALVRTVEAQKQEINDAHRQALRAAS